MFARRGDVLGIFSSGKHFVYSLLSHSVAVDEDLWSPLKDETLLELPVIIVGHSQLGGWLEDVISNSITDLAIHPRQSSVPDGVRSNRVSLNFVCTGRDISGIMIRTDEE